MPLGGVEACGVVPGSSPSLHGVVPRGAIVMWSGMLDHIPPGWALCDGTEGTPNLVARFPRGIAAATRDPGATGGADSVTVLQNAHQHELPFNHPTSMAARSTASFGSGGSVAGVQKPSSNDADTTSGARWKTQSVTPTNQAHDNRPAYYELAFIMKL